jgi:hypothetical protein
VSPAELAELVRQDLEAWLSNGRVLAEKTGRATRTSLAGGGASG